MAEKSEAPRPRSRQPADARRDQILDAATRVFSTSGFHGATIREIAREAGLAEGTIYIHFTNKQDLLLGILSRLNESERRAADLGQGLAGDDFRAFVTGYLRHRLSVLEQDLRTFQAVLPDLLLQADLRERYMREVLAPSLQLSEPLLRHFIARGALRPAPAGTDPQVAVALMLRAIPAMVLGLLVLRMLGDQTVAEQWAALPAWITNLLFDGLEPRS